MLSSLGMGLRGENLGKLIPWISSLGIIIGILTWSRRFATPKAGLYASLLFYTCPMVATQTWFTLSELNWAFFGFLAAYAMAVGLEAEMDLSRRWLALSGVLAGLAFGTKYNAVWIIAALSAVMAAGRLRARRAVTADLLCFLSFTALVSAPWLRRLPV